MTEVTIIRTTSVERILVRQIAMGARGLKGDKGDKGDPGGMYLAVDGGTPTSSFTVEGIDGGGP